MEYKVVTVSTGFFSGRLSASKLERALNLHTSGGWRFSKSIHESQRWLFFFSREAHFLVFERESCELSHATQFETVAANEEGSLWVWIVVVVVFGVLAYFASQYAK
jgi:hypothetical protein